MGSAFNVRRYRGTRDEVLKKWNADVEQAGYEDGHSYSGSISELGGGFHDTGKVFDNFDDAQAYIEEHHQKWDGAMAVKYKAKGGITKPQASKMAKLQAKADRAVAELDMLRRKVLDELRNAKSKTVGCKLCGSSIRRSYLHDRYCPVCRNNLLSPTARQRLERANQAISRAQEELRNYKPKRHENIKELVWLIGGWCSE